MTIKMKIALVPFKVSSYLVHPIVVPSIRFHCISAQTPLGLQTRLNCPIYFPLHFRSNAARAPDIHRGPLIPLKCCSGSRQSFQSPLLPRFARSLMVLPHFVRSHWGLPNFVRLLGVLPHFARSLGVLPHFVRSLGALPRFARSLSTTWDPL